MDYNIHSLQEIFPSHSPQELRKALEISHHSIELAIQKILEKGEKEKIPHHHQNHKYIRKKVSVVLNNPLSSSSPVSDFSSSPPRVELSDFPSLDSLLLIGPDGFSFEAFARALPSDNRLYGNLEENLPEDYYLLSDSEDEEFIDSLLEGRPYKQGKRGKNNNEQIQQNRAQQHSSSSSPPLSSAILSPAVHRASLENFVSYWRIESFEAARVSELSAFHENPSSPCFHLEYLVKLESYSNIHTFWFPVAALSRLLPQIRLDRLASAFEANCPGCSERLAAMKSFTSSISAANFKLKFPSCSLSSIASALSHPLYSAAFHPEFSQFDCILAHSGPAWLTVGALRLYFVKWRGLSLARCSWESEQFLLQLGGEKARRKIANYQEMCMEFPRPCPGFSSGYGNHSQLAEKPLARGTIPFLSVDSTAPPPPALFPHQVETLEFLLDNYLAQPTRNCLLADDGAMGKTAAFCSFLNEIHFNSSLSVCGTALQRPILIIVAAPLARWESELALHCPRMVVLPFLGSEISQLAAQSLELLITSCLPRVGEGFSSPSEHHEAGEFRCLGHLRCHIVLTTQDAFTADFQGFFSKVSWNSVFIEPEHRGLSLEAPWQNLMKSLKFRHLTINMPGWRHSPDDEGWPILNTLQPEFFDEARKMQWAEEWKAVENLSAREKSSWWSERLKGWALRRTEFGSLIAKLSENCWNLLTPRRAPSPQPCFSERIILLEMPEFQRFLYRAIYQQNLGRLAAKRRHKEDLSEAGDSDSNNPPFHRNRTINSFKHPVTGILKELRRCCIHAKLIDPAYQNENEGKVAESLELSGKLLFLEKFLEERRHRDEPLLILCYSQYSIDLVEELCSKKRFPVEKADFQKNFTQRQTACENFQRLWERKREKTEEIKEFEENTEGKNPIGKIVGPVLLVQNKLMLGDTLGVRTLSVSSVIIFDSNPDPAEDRIGLSRYSLCPLFAQRPVEIFRLYMKDSIEAAVAASAARKSLEALEAGGAQGDSVDSAFRFVPANEPPMNIPDPHKSFSALQLKVFLREGAFAGESSQTRRSRASEWIAGPAEKLVESAPSILWSGPRYSPSEWRALSEIVSPSSSLSVSLDDSSFYHRLDFSSPATALLSSAANSSVGKRSANIQRNSSRFPTGMNMTLSEIQYQEKLWHQLKGKQASKSKRMKITENSQQKQWPRLDLSLIAPSGQIQTGPVVAKAENLGYSGVPEQQFGWGLLEPDKRPLENSNLPAPLMIPNIPNVPNSFEGPDSPESIQVRFFPDS